jgi:hypothetical protein
MHKGEQLQQVEPGKLRIAQPLPDERRVQHNHGRLRRSRDRLPTGERLHAPIA